MRKENLRAHFNEAIRAGAKYVAVKIETRGMPQPEYIINPRENFGQKLVYYMSAYNDDLVLKTYDGIKITGFAKGNTITECLAWLMGEKQNEAGTAKEIV